jgi:hypothetical protein
MIFSLSPTQVEWALLLAVIAIFLIVLMMGIFVWRTPIVQVRGNRDWDNIKSKLWGLVTTGMQRSARNG